MQQVPRTHTCTSASVTGADTCPATKHIGRARRTAAPAPASTPFPATSSLMRSCARCRCVCALWRALVDGRGLLLPHALPPRAFPGFFANARVKPRRRPGPGFGFLPPPASRPLAPDRLAFRRAHLPRGGAEAAVRHQCNGLVLCFQDAPGAAGFVCNPTTERWAGLPPRRRGGRAGTRASSSRSTRRCRWTTRCSSSRCRRLGGATAMPTSQPRLPGRGA